MIAFALTLVAAPAPADMTITGDAGTPPPPPAQGASVPPAPAPESSSPGTTPGETRQGELFGPPYGSRVGEKREGEVWRPIEGPTYDKQPVPSESAVTGQSNPDLTDSLSKKKQAPPTGESRQRFALEVKMGPYLPDVDRNWSGEGFGPYAKVFGETDSRGITIGPPKKSIYGGLAFEWQITKKLAGPIGIGIQWTMARDKAQAPLAEPPDEGPTRSRADTVRFTVMPIAFQAVYRFELLADKVRWAPFVPYVKAGVAYAFWWTKNGNGNIAVIKDGTEVVDRGRGGVWGYQINLGMMLRLDFLDPGTARTFDRISGINHTYIIGEWQLTRLSNFGRKDSMNLGDSTWMIGLATEF
ncbi:MXAN_2562 family outer membrane beta-barrel protein [Nannocystis bainbridge]|uniref:MXAN_2562 family outer membrane beta-barrel protein n=1 Tax=Nannocystis bainbridge TaxID=2995303 RepID=A0ABT5DQN2_9BACT|nr:MXAN_2562 family outer membrane beta-barrel protein [Nannocystis bainbridge]MDC0715909.1 MXAN_2562 family outer membrane beta-barrel protein [Nannocystis bainbridge]